MSTAVAIFQPGTPEILPDTLAVIRQWEDFCRAALSDGPIPMGAIGDEIANQVAQAESVATPIRDSIEKMSEEARAPYFRLAKEMKAKSDAALVTLSTLLGELHSQLLDHRTAKIRLEEKINRHRQEEAERLQREERERQRKIEMERIEQERAERERLRKIEEARQAEVNAVRRAELDRLAAEERKAQEEAAARREAERAAELAKVESLVPEAYVLPRAEGVKEKIAWEYEITDLLVFAFWCIQNRSNWINRAKLQEAFLVREIKEYLNSDSCEDRSFPGFRVYRALGINVKKTKPGKPINVQSAKVALD